MNADEWDGNVVVVEVVSSDESEVTVSRQLVPYQVHDDPLRSRREHYLMLRTQEDGQGPDAEFGDLGRGGPGHGGAGSADRWQMQEQICCLWIFWGVDSYASFQHVTVVGGFRVLDSRRCRRWIR